MSGKKEMDELLKEMGVEVSRTDFYKKKQNQR
jgi:hypothetical protein